MPITRDGSKQKCWKCLGQKEPHPPKGMIDAQKASLCPDHEQERIRHLMGLDRKPAPMSAHRMVV